MTWPDDYLIPGIEPYHVEEAGIIYCARAEDVLSLLPTESIDLVFTSPPYNLGNFQKGSYYAGKYKKGDKLIYKSHNDNMDEGEYQKWQHNILRLAYKIINNNGAIFYNLKPRVNKGIWDDRKGLLPYPIRQEIVWDRCGMTNFSGSFYANSTERIYIIVKEEWKPNKEYLGLGEVWRIPPETNNPHPAPFPLNLAERVVVSGSPLNGICFDFFAGSGTLGVAAKKAGRRFILCEIEPTYVDMAVKRLRQGVLGF